MRTFIAAMTALLLHSTPANAVTTYYPTPDGKPPVEANGAESKADTTVSATGRVGTYNLYDDLASIQYNLKRGTDIGVLRERIQGTLHYDIQDEYYLNLRSTLNRLIEDQHTKNILHIN